MLLIKASAPGSVMIAGEHAVLRGSDAVAMAINRRLTVTLTERDDNQWHLISQLGEVKCDSQHFPTNKPWQWIGEILQYFAPSMKHTYNVIIDSEIDSSKGLGSSAALLVAGIAACYQASHNRRPIPNELISIAYELLQKIQGMGSGTDLAASIFGGVVLYSPNNQTAKRIADALPHHLVYSGSKTPTADVITWVNQQNNTELEVIYHRISELVPMIADAIVQSQPEKLAPLISEHQMLMANMSLNNEGIESILADCKKDQSIAKISGSGLGDCVIILNKKVKKFPRNDDQKKLGIQSLNTLTCTRGVTIESS